MTAATPIGDVRRFLATECRPTQGCISNRYIHRKISRRTIGRSPRRPGHLPSFGTPNDVPSLAAPLLSDDGSFITAQTISVDGGVTFRP
ncbi:SDR family oxidoreductase [Mycolicibacterium sp. GF69]|uniref:SDR family oxidoreductase n=1 Tax=Mycolicibacterium sp. GF69 TaxID=2267251 RepID=UPI001F0BF03F|nr:SDR family oxidoreductase [Mycolicibacterium sp. GF69]